jgi:tetratricopeptide (TPR) repeat protein
MDEIGPGLAMELSGTGGRLMMTDSAPQGSVSDPLDAALRHHREGRFAEAASKYREILAREPDHPRAQLLLAMILSDGPEMAESEALLRCRLAIADGLPLMPETLAAAQAQADAPGPDRIVRRFELAMVFFELGKLRQRRGDDRESILLFEAATILNPDYAQAFNNLALSLHRIGRRDLALDVLDRALAIDPDFAVALRNRGRILLELHRAPEALAAFERWVALEPNSVEALTNTGIAAQAVPDMLRAETALRCAISLNPAHIDAYVQLANTLDQLHRSDEAAVFRREAARRTGVANQRCTGQAQARILIVGGAGMCNMNMQFLLDRRRFDATCVYLQAPGEYDPIANGTIEGFPACDVAVNAVADADKGLHFLGKSRDFIGRFDLPVINPPDHRIARTTRDGVAALMAGIPGLTVPAMRRLPRDVLVDLTAPGTRFDKPLLVRPIGVHGGDDLERIEDRAALAGYLAAVPSPEFYASEFHDYRGADGYWRKYRLIFVDREVYPYHLTIGRDWKLHYYRVDMMEQPWMKPEEEAFLADWRSAFPGQLGDAVSTVARRLDLDFAGIDCSIGRDGNVLLFEANPSMLVHLTELRAEFPYKHKYVPRIIEAFSAMVLKRIEAHRPAAGAPAASRAA